VFVLNGSHPYLDATSDIKSVARLFSISTSFTKTKQVFFLVAICFFSFFVNLDAHDVDLMEARNFITAREISTNGNWLLPTMNGDIRINKPPLPTWVTAAARILGGNTDNTVIMRIPAAMMATMLVFSVWGFMKTLSEDDLLPFIAAAILATSLLVIDQGRRGTWDIYCHSFMMAGIWAFSWGCNKTNHAFAAFALAGIALACSFMSKGPVSFYALLLPFCIGYVYAFGFNKIKEKRVELLLALALFAAVSSIWPIWLYLKYPVLINIVKQEASAWSSRHIEPFYYYIQFPLYTGIWAAVTIAAFVKPNAKNRIDDFGNSRFILTWIILSLLLLSIVPEKKERYLLPAMIPVAIMAGCLIRSLIHRKSVIQANRGDRIFLGIHTGILVIVSLAAPVMVFLYGMNHNLSSPVLASVVTAAFVVTAGKLVVFNKRKAVAQLFMSSILLICLINLTMLPILFRTPLFRNNPDFRSLREVQTIEAIKDLDFFYIDRINPKRVWAAGKPVKRWKYHAGRFPTAAPAFVILSDFDPREKIAAIYSERLELNVLDTYRYDSKNPRRIKYLTLIRIINKTDE
jgi:4-amino-4-deoxy-L-arabinose transferase-like glycosyltransferase